MLCYVLRSHCPFSIPFDLSLFGVWMNMSGSIMACSKPINSITSKPMQDISAEIYKFYLQLHQNSILIFSLIKRKKKLLALNVSKFLIYSPFGSARTGSNQINFAGRSGFSNRLGSQWGIKGRPTSGRPMGNHNWLSLHVFDRGARDLCRAPSPRRPKP